MDRPRARASADSARIEASVEFDLKSVEEVLFQRLRSRLASAGPGWLSVSGAARYLDTSPAAVRQLIRRDHLRAYRPEGGTLRLSTDEIDHWVRGNR